MHKYEPVQTVEKTRRTKADPHSTHIQLLTVIFTATCFGFFFGIIFGFSAWVWEMRLHPNIMCSFNSAICPEETGGVFELKEAPSSLPQIPPELPNKFVQDAPVRLPGTDMNRSNSVVQNSDQILSELGKMAISPRADSRSQLYFEPSKYDESSLKPHNVVLYGSASPEVQQASGTGEVHLFQWCYGNCRPRDNCKNIHNALAVGLVPNLLTNTSDITGMGHFEPKNTIARALIRSIAEFPPEDIVIIADLNDVMFFGEDIRDEIFHKYGPFQDRVVFGTENNCWHPNNDWEASQWLEKKYGSLNYTRPEKSEYAGRYYPFKDFWMFCTHPRYPKPAYAEGEGFDHIFLNSGFYLASAKAMAKILKEYFEFQDKEPYLTQQVCQSMNDQCVWNAFVLESSDISLDYNVEFVFGGNHHFLSTMNRGGTTHSPNAHLENGRIVHDQSSTKPFALHANGVSKYLWREAMKSVAGAQKDQRVLDEFYYDNQKMKFSEICDGVKI